MNINCGGEAKGKNTRRREEMRKELSEGEKLVNRNVKVENQKCDQQLMRLICITGEKFS